MSACCLGVYIVEIKNKICFLLLAAENKQLRSSKGNIIIIITPGIVLYACNNAVEAFLSWAGVEYAVDNNYNNSSCMVDFDLCTYRSSNDTICPHCWLCSCMVVLICVLIDLAMTLYAHTVDYALAWLFWSVYLSI